MKSSRRDFLQISGLTLGALGLPSLSSAKTNLDSVSLIVDPSDPVSSSAACRWAAEDLSQALAQHGVKLGRYSSLDQAPRHSLCIVVLSDQNKAKQLIKKADVPLPDGPESLALLPVSTQDKRGMLAFGDTRGLMYALLELADRVRNSDQPIAALEQHQATIERPFNAVRSNGRIFCSDIQDKPWFNDREMWPEYFSMLATQRFNRFSLNFGIGYDFLDNVSDAYFLFTYPFLLAVPGYDVRAVNLPGEERDRNLEMLQFISSQAVARGIDFQLGIWTHGYQWGPASQPNYTIDGVTPENHAAYSRDALTALLKACPDISGVTLRTHGESGVREGSYKFWSTVFSALPASGRKVRLGLHTKGLNQELIDAALATEMPVTLEPKYWAEHMGLPYQQAAIRELEMPHEERDAKGFFSLSSGSRSFTRYGYADFLREDRKYEVMFRIWPGSHRLLLWGDPVSAAAHARAFNICGCNGVELFEPLSFKGRRGSGIAGSRCAYADKSLEPRWDWEKYLYTYRTWGRLIYNPETPPNVWRRYLSKQFGAAARSLEAALSSATPIMEIITTAHLPSAANEGFSPEYYTNQSIVDASKPSPYSDTPSPKVFGNVSPLDPQLFSAINEYVAEAFKGQRTGKYSPVAVAQLLEITAEKAASQLREAERKVSDKNSPEFRRAVIDLRIAIGIGLFFTAKFRSGVLYAAYEQTGGRTGIELALRHYRRAREYWRDFAEGAKAAYVPDITFGTAPHQRGNWLDRLPAIDDDIAEMQKRLDSAPANTRGSSPLFGLAPIVEPRELANIQHKPAASFIPGQPLDIDVTLLNQAKAIRLYYRHVNQAERWQSAGMSRTGSNSFSSTVPGDYTNRNYPLQYYFEVRDKGEVWFFPGLWSKLQPEPYFVVPGRIADK